MKAKVIVNTNVLFLIGAIMLFVNPIGLMNVVIYVIGFVYTATAGVYVETALKDRIRISPAGKIILGFLWPILHIAAVIASAIMKLFFTMIAIFTERAFQFDDSRDNTR
jgi:hypothetical protein